VGERKPDKELLVTDQRIHDYVAAHEQRFLDELKQLVAIPSVSTLSVHHEDCRRAAQWLVDQLGERVGMTAEMIETAGRPLVYGEWLGAPGQPTVLLYGHYDVQPVDPIELWRTPPFEPTVVGESLYGRGASDDKGPTLAAIKALEALAQATGGLPVNLKVLIEGEEECGGEAVAAFVHESAERLRADCALVLDTGALGPGEPAITHALRGIVYTEIRARVAERDMHSGVYGGIAPNPLQSLAWVLADLKGRDGRINLPGLYELLRPLSDAERAALTQQSERSGPLLQGAAGLSALTGEPGFSVEERRTARPTFEVHGIVGGFIGEGAKTVIPAEARAKVSLRLAPGQRPDDVFGLLRQRVAELAPPGVTLELANLHGGEAVLLPIDSPFLAAASVALEDEFGKRPEIVREGGSIPIVALFDRVLGIGSVMLGFGLADDNVHAPNEKVHLPHYIGAIRSVAGFLQQLGTLS
jgi:acetylornithine deacetylase/succinyl-diaminopimelate desuccinylase-like protein